MKNREVEQIYVDVIPIPDRHRSINLDAVKLIAGSMAKIGLRTPITLRAIGDTGVELIAGAHRLAAAKQLGWEKIDCIVLDCDEVEAEMWEISENLHRAELTQVERGEQIGRWVALGKIKGAQLAHPVAKKKQSQPADKAISAAAKEFGVDRREIQRALKIASLSEEAKQAARDAGLDDNQSALLQAAKAPLSQQAEVIRNRSIPVQKEWGEVEEDQKRRLMSAWNAASPAVKAWFKDQIDEPVMDRRFGT